MDKNFTVSHAPRAWLAAGLCGDAATWGDDSQAAGDALFACAETEGVAALVHAMWASRLLPAATARRFAERERAAIARELLDHAELVRVLRALAGANVPVLLLKGAALAYSLYPAPHLRPRSDVDLLFPDQASVERAKAVLAPLGYTASEVPSTTTISFETGMHRTTVGGSSHHLDMHWRIANQVLFTDALHWAELASAAVPLPALDATARALCPMHALLHACMHRISHLPWDTASGGHGDRLIWLYDFHLLAQRLTAEDFTAFCRLAAERRLAGACFDGLREAQRAFVTPLPDGVLDTLAQAAGREAFDVSRARRRWYQEWHNLRTLPLTKQVAFAREKLFPSTAYMREQYAVDGPVRLAWAYLRRLGNGVRMTLFRAR